MELYKLLEALVKRPTAPYAFGRPLARDRELYSKGKGKARRDGLRDRAPPGDRPLPWGLEGLNVYGLYKA